VACQIFPALSQKSTLFGQRFNPASKFLGLQEVADRFVQNRKKTIRKNFYFMSITLA